jgi:hypothetical protein
MNKSKTEIDHYIFSLIRRLRKLNYRFKITYQIKQDTFTLILNERNLFKRNIQFFLITVSFGVPYYLIEYLVFDNKSNHHNHKDRINKIEVKGMIDVDEVIKDLHKIMSITDDDTFYPHYPF